MSLTSTVWSALNPPKSSYTFDATKNTIDNTAMIPIVYGTRKFGGVQTWDWTASDAKTKKKDIIISEGTITSVKGVAANGHMLNDDTLFAVVNNAYSDATVLVKDYDGGDDKVLVLYANGTTTNIRLRSVADIAKDQSNDYQCSTVILAQYIEKLGMGWTIVDNSGVDRSPRAIKFIGYTEGGAFTASTSSPVSCYKTPVDCIVAGMSSCDYSFYNGSSTQTPPSNYATVGSYKNCGWLRASFKISSTLQGSNPTISAVVKGKQVYDPRTGLTAYSENPALCLMDYVLSKRYGMGRWIAEDDLDMDSWVEVADYCDAEISYVDAYGCTITEPRYRLNIILAEKRKNIDNIQAILATFAGFLVFSGDKLSLRIEKQESISYSFDPSNIKEKSVKFEQQDLESSPNRYEITYYDPAQNWVGVKVTVEDSADQYQRGNVITKDVQLQGCIHQGQALRLGRIYKALNRLCPNVVTFSTGTMAMHLQPGDIIEFSYGVLSKLPMRILQITQNKGSWTIKAQQYNLSIYDDALGSQISVGNYVQVPNAISDVVPDVSGITLGQTYYLQGDGTVVSDISIGLTLPAYNFLRRALLFYSIDGGTSWVSIGETTDETYVIHNAVVGNSYVVKAVIENTVGRTSTGVTSDAIVVTGKDSPPSNVASITATVDGVNVTVEWTAVNDVDLRNYQLTIGDTITSLVDTKYTYTADVTGDTTLSVVAVDNSGNTSEIPAVTTLTTSVEPPDIDSFWVEETDALLRRFYWKITSTPTNLAGYLIRYNWGDNRNWSGAIPLYNGIVSQSPFETSALRGDVYTIMIKAVNTAGFESVNVKAIVVGYGSQLVDNVVFTADFAGFSGTKTNCEVYEGTLRAIDPGTKLYQQDAFYKTDEAALMWDDNTKLVFSCYGKPMYSSRNAMFYQAVYPEMQYDDSFTVDKEGLLSVSYTGEGNARLYYNREYPQPMYPQDSALMFADDSYDMFTEISEYTQYTGKVTLTPDTVRIRANIASGSVRGTISKLQYLVDVPDITEIVNDLSVTSTATITPTKAFTKIVNVSITLQSGTAHTAKVLSKDPVQIGLYDTAGNPASGVVDLILQGY